MQTIPNKPNLNNKTQQYEGKQLSQKSRQMTSIDILPKKIYE